MKRIISLIIIISLFLSFLAFPSYAEEFGYPENYEDMKGLLKAVGIIDENYGEYNGYITRAEFVTLIAKATGITPYMPDDSVPLFTDVTEDNEFAKYIWLAKERQLVNGYSDGSFKPEENISLTEGIVLAVNLLGYNVLAGEFGGYPTGYTTLANQCGLYKNLKNYTVSKLTHNAAVVLIYNALNTETLKPDKVSVDGNGYASYKGETLLYDNFGIKLIEGIMDGIDLTRLVGDNDVPPYKVSINNKLLRRAETNANDYLGYYVLGWYKEINGQDSLVYVCKKTGRNTETEIEIENITDISGYKIHTVSETGKTQSESYESYSVIIYNGMSTGYSFNISMLKDEKGEKLDGTVKLLDNNGDGRCDVIFVDAYREFVVGRIEPSQKRVYDYFDPSDSLILDTSVNEPYTLLYDADGNSVTIGKVQRYSSIMLYTSKDDAKQMFHKGYISATKITGMLELKYQDDNNNWHYVINGTDYPVSKKLVANKDGVLGRSIELTLNAKGKGVYLRYTGEDSIDWGMFIKCGEKASDEVYLVAKIMNSNGVLENLEFAENVKIDNIPYSLPKDIKIVKEHIEEAFLQNNYISDISSPGYIRDTDDDKAIQMIKYSLNTSGKIRYIDTCLHSYNGSGNPKSTFTDRFTSEANNEVYLVKISKSGTFNGYYSTYDSSFGGKAFVSEDAKMYLYPQRGVNDESLYLILGKDYIKNLHRTDIKAYYDNKDSLLCDVFLKPYTDYKMDLDTNEMLFSVVEKMNDVVDNEGMPAKKIYMHSGGVKTTVVADAEVSDVSGTKMIKDLKPGDIIYYSVNNISGKLMSFQLRYDYDNKTVVSGSDAKNGHYSSLAYAYAACDDGIIYVNYSDDLNDNVNDDKDCEEIEKLYKNGNYRLIKLPSSVVVTVVEEELNGTVKISTGNINSFDTFYISKNDASRLIVHTYSAYGPKEVFIIK